MKDRTTSIVKILTIGAVVAVLAPPVVNAATNNVRIQDADSQQKAQVTGSGALKVSDGAGGFNVNANITNGNLNTNAKMQDSEGENVNSQVVPPMGLFDAAGSTGAVDVSIFSGGGGFLGAGDCTEEDENPETNPTRTPQDNTSVINPAGQDDAPADVIVNGIMLTGSSLAGGDPAANLRVFSQTVANGALPLLELTVNGSEPNAIFSSATGLALTANLTFTCTGGNGQYVILGQGDPAPPAP